MESVVLGAVMGGVVLALAVAIYLARCLVSGWRIRQSAFGVGPFRKEIPGALLGAGVIFLLTALSDANDRRADGASALQGPDHGE